MYLSVGLTCISLMTNDIKNLHIRKGYNLNFYIKKKIKLQGIKEHLEHRHP